MKFFPTGAGLIAICSLFIICLLTAIFKRTIIAKYFFVAFISCLLLYLSIGNFLFFRPSFFSHGSTYFNSNIKNDAILTHLDRANSVQDLVDRLFFKKKSLIDQHEIKPKDGPNYTMTHYIWSANKSRIDIYVYSYLNSFDAKQAYDIMCESSYKHYPDRCLRDYYGFKKIEDYNGWYFVVFPINYDGTKFYLPFVDTDSPFLSMYVYYDNSIVEISESTENINGFALTKILNSSS